MKYHKLRIAWSVMWGVAGVLLIVFWARTYYRYEGGGVNLAVGTFYFVSASGGLQIAWTSEPEYQLPSTPGWTLRSYLVKPERRQVSKLIVPWFSRNFDGTVIPYWFLVVSTTASAALPWIRRRYSLRTLLIATTLVAVVLGLSAWLG